MTVTMLPSWFLKGSELPPPLVATTLAPAKTYCEQWRKIVGGHAEGAEDDRCPARA